MIDYQELKRLAEAATQCSGPRRVETDYNGVHQVLGDGSWKILSAWHTPDGKGLANAQFSAAANPANVLALIAEVEALRESATFKAVQSLRADCEDLRKDAERYRWLIHNAEEIYVCNQNLNLDPHYCGKEKLKQEADQVIDLAIQQETK